LLTFNFELVNEVKAKCQHQTIPETGLTHLISVQRSDGVFLLETDWLFEGL